MVKSPEFKVGLTVILAIIIVVFGVMWGTGFRMSKHDFFMTVYFDQAYGLSVDDPVTVSGVRQGAVSSIRLENGKVYVRLVLKTPLTLPADSKVFIKNIGLMGERFIAIELGASQQLLDLAKPVAGEHEASMSDVFGGLGPLLEKTEQTINHLDRLVGNPEFERSLKLSIANLETLVTTLSKVVKENRGPLSTAITDFKESSQTLKNAVGSRETELKGAVDNFVGSAQQMRTTMAHLEELSGTFKKVADRVEQGQGALGELVNNKELYNKMLKSIDNLDGLIKDIKDNPDKYTKGIKVKVF
jgi:phospholipid/cholesterol/gamma-HCH transport system substrate-binding protein